MTKRLLIDGAHEEEVRVAIADEDKLEKFEFEILSKTQIKGNIYLAKIIRVEPSLQAAFVDYGGGKHGFLSFSEIHPNYYQIPISDKEKLDSIIENECKRIDNKRNEEGIDPMPEDEKETMIYKIRSQFFKKYTIQEVIKKRQVILVQVTKEERGNKGAALTTYISLAGRYCILMPNTHRPCGISKKISASAERKKIKEILASFNIPIESCVVVRTAGLNRTKQELRRDYEYLYKMWKEILEEVVHSQAPCLINEEAGIVKRSIRDMYSKEISEIIIEGEKSYKIAKNFMKKILPSHAKKVKLYEDKSMPLFSKFNLNEQVDQIYSTRVNLPSGGYLVINTTEALVAIDVNSGKSIKERSIGDMALKTNLEAAVEVVRQAKLRDLGGLIVVDFIDMNDPHHDALVEKTVKEAFKDDKAKTQVSEISVFGLLEISRQRLRPNLMETHRISCPYCNGTGTIWSTESMIVQALRELEKTCSAVDVKDVKITFSPQTAVYLLNHKRSFISSIENSRNCKICVAIDYDMSLSDFSVEPISFYHNEEDDDTQVEDVVTKKVVDKGNKRGRSHNNDVVKEEQNLGNSDVSLHSKKLQKKRRDHQSFDGNKNDAADGNNSSNVIKSKSDVKIRKNTKIIKIEKTSQSLNDVDESGDDITSENRKNKRFQNKSKNSKQFKINRRMKVSDIKDSEVVAKDSDDKKEDSKSELLGVDSKSSTNIENILDIVNTAVNNVISTVEARQVIESIEKETPDKNTISDNYLHVLQNAISVREKMEDSSEKASDRNAMIDKVVGQNKVNIKDKKGWWNKLLKQ